jgi:hypothetical protein
MPTGHRARSAPLAIGNAIPVLQLATEEDAKPVIDRGKGAAATQSWLSVKGNISEVQ